MDTGHGYNDSGKEAGMKTFSLEQGSLEWFAVRAGIPTASEFGNLVTDKFKPRSGEMPETYMARKLAEKWIGGPLAGFMTHDLERGQILETQAIPYYEIMFGETVSRPGFITTDDGLIGCSPDGVINNEIGLEVKCLQMQNHVKILMKGEMPEEYGPQVHGGMLVTGFKAWRFMSYCPGFPPFITLIERDEEIQKVLKTALDAFLARFDKEFAKMVQLNGGELPKRNTFRDALLRPEAEKESELVDINV